VDEIEPFLLKCTKLCVKRVFLHSLWAIFPEEFAV